MLMVAASRLTAGKSQRLDSLKLYPLSTHSTHSTHSLPTLPTLYPRLLASLSHSTTRAAAISHSQHTFSARAADICVTLSTHLSTRRHHLSTRISRHASQHAPLIPSWCGPRRPLSTHAQWLWCPSGAQWSSSVGHHAQWVCAATADASAIVLRVDVRWAAASAFAPCTVPSGVTGPHTSHALARLVELGHANAPAENESSRSCESDRHRCQTVIPLRTRIYDFNKDLRMSR
jgi:hypothetical protein